MKVTIPDWVSITLTEEPDTWVELTDTIQGRYDSADQSTRLRSRATGDSNMTTAELAKYMGTICCGCCSPLRDGDEDVCAKCRKETTLTPEQAELLTHSPSIREASAPAACDECGIALRPGITDCWCDVCHTMAQSVRAQRGLVAAHVEWERENARRLAHKAHLLSDGDN